MLEGLTTLFFASPFLFRLIHKHFLQFFMVSYHFKDNEQIFT
jgi:hypothetical protein